MEGIDQKVEYDKTDENSTQVQNKHKRRTRNESTSDRNYNCGCGKSYLSYPALYLHLKNKHNGKAPEGTMLPNSNGKGSKGRPKEQAGKGEAQVQNDDALIALQQYVEKQQSQFTKKQENQEQSEQLKYIIQCFEDKLCDDFKEDYKPIIDCLEKQLKKNEQDMDDDESQNQSDFEEFQKNNEDLWQAKLNKILSLYLQRILSYIHNELFKDIVFFIGAYAHTLNNIGWNMMLQQKPNSLPEENKQKFCSENNGEYALEVCNEFIIEYLPNLLKKLAERKLSLRLLGTEPSEIQNAVFITQYFTDWLFDNNFTNSKLQITGEISNQIKNLNYSQ